MTLKANPVTLTLINLRRSRYHHPLNLLNLLNPLNPGHGVPPCPLFFFLKME